MANAKSRSVEDCLKRAQSRIDKAGIQTGNFLFHLNGNDGGDYQIGAHAADMKGDAGGDTHGPTVEIWGDAATIGAILDGKKDPVKQFLVGKMRVRGNLRHLSDVGVQLGILKEPL